MSASGAGTSARTFEPAFDGDTVLTSVQLLDEMDEQMWGLLQRNLAGITEAEADWRPHPLARQLSYFGRYDVSVLGLLKTHALHLAGHRFQIRYVRGTYSRAHGTRKADFDPW